jgi:glycosyltransferase involved in cell wall biosynthesis
VGTSVSVIIPVCNAEEYIAEAIDSVLAQSCANVECIVIDDGSTDRTAEIVRGYGERVSYIHQANAERSAARNNGIAHASGKYVSFLDADDQLLPDKLTEQAAFLEVHPEYDVVYSRVKYFKKNGKRNYYVVKRVTPTGDIVPFLINTNFITMNSPLIRRGAVERVGGFDVSLCRYEDWDFFLRLSLTGSRFGFMDATHALCRMHGMNTVKDALRMFEAKLSVACKIAGRFGNELRARGIDGNAVVAFHQADYGRKLILAGRVEEGRKYILEACEHFFPHRRKFKLFSMAAELCGYRFLALLQRCFDRLVKYRNLSEGD